MKQKENDLFAHLDNNVRIATTNVANGEINAPFDTNSEKTQEGLHQRRSSNAVSCSHCCSFRWIHHQWIVMISLTVYTRNSHIFVKIWPFLYFTFLILSKKKKNQQQPSQIISPLSSNSLLCNSQQLIFFQFNNNNNNLIRRSINFHFVILITVQTNQPITCWHVLLMSHQNFYSFLSLT